MKAVALHGFDGSASVGIAGVPGIAPGPGEIGISVAAAGLNPADWKLAEGWLRDTYQPSFPYVLGFDAAGTIDAIGPGVADFAIGDRVVAKTAVGRGGAGGCAERTVVAAHLASILPDAIDFITAAALPTAGITAWESTLVAGALRAGQSILINGGAGGTGSFAIGIARMTGARIAATAGAKNLAYLSELGCDLALDYRTDWRPRLRERFPDGVDVLLDTVGQGVLDHPLDLIRDGGIFVTIGTLVRNEPRPPEQRGIRILTSMSNREREGEQLGALVNALASARLRPPAIETISPVDVPAALDRLKGGHVRGKLVVDIAGRRWQ